VDEKRSYTFRFSSSPLYTVAPGDAALDVGLSHALLNDAADRGREAVRVWTPPPAVSFGRLDLLSGDVERAAAVARADGLEPVRRLAGGRAAAIGPGTACLGFATPAANVTSGMRERYEMLSAMVLDALARLGIDARLGELAGEWCAGAWSVLVGEGKVGGLAQRVVRGGAWAEAVVVVSGAPGLRASLDRVHQALGLDWRPETLVGLEDVTVEEVRGALTAAAGTRPADVPEELWERALALRAEHAM
jgi:lipoate-protein ligase A